MAAMRKDAAPMFTSPGLMAERTIMKIAENEIMSSAKPAE